LANPWRYARTLDAPPESDVWRRNIMTVVWLTVIWAAVVLAAWMAGWVPGRI
jgi:hypothetical protein